MFVAHLITGESSPLRLMALRLYARREVRLLAMLFRLLNSRMIGNRFVSEGVYRLLVLPSAKWGIAGTPLAPEELEGFFASLEPGRIAVGPCRCRLAHDSCDHPLQTDIVIKRGFGIWTELFGGDYREISRSEAISLCRRLHGQGLAQIAYRHLDAGENRNEFVICNCCTDGCLPLMSMKFYGADRYPFHRGGMIAVVDRDRCRGCGECVAACPFDCRAVSGGRAVIFDCYGCGLCETACAGGAARMETRTDEGVRDEG